VPELPEVETVRRGLAGPMEGRRILRAEVRREGLRWPFPEGLAARLEGRRVEHLGRRSKYLLAELSGGETLLVHLGMSGRITVSAPGNTEARSLGTFVHPHRAPETHDHLVLHLEDGLRVTLNDPRRFGAVDLLDTARRDAHPLLRGLGPEPLGNAFAEPYLAARLAGRRTSAKAALLDQAIVAGLGNIYVCEALFRAGISPRRRAGRISRVRLARLVAAIRTVLAEAIEAGGSSLRDYRQADGELGYFQHSFAVYGREGGPCTHEGCGGTVRRIVQSGRSTFYCPSCQR